LVEKHFKDKKKKLEIRKTNAKLRFSDREENYKRIKRLDVYKKIK